MSGKQRPVILCVDDATDLLALMAKALGADHQVLTADNAGDAISLAFGDPAPDLILLDVDMPDVSGFEVCRALKAEPPTASIPVMFLTAKAEAAAEVEALQLGAVDYVTKPLKPEVLRSRVGLHFTLALRHAELERLLQQRSAELDASRAETIRCLARALELHDGPAGERRMQRLANYAKLLAQAAGAKPELADMMMKAAPVYDVGRLAAPDEPRRHPELGAWILGAPESALVKLACTLALAHREHWDGSGYPQGLKGEAIPWAGRVMALVESFETLTAQGLEAEAAAAEIIKHAGTKYDPALMEPFQRAVPVLKKVRNLYS